MSYYSLGTTSYINRFLTFDILIFFSLNNLVMIFKKQFRKGFIFLYSLFLFNILHWSYVVRTAPTGFKYRSTKYSILCCLHDTRYKLRSTVKPDYGNLTSSLPIQNTLDSLTGMAPWERHLIYFT